MANKKVINGIAWSTISSIFRNGVHLIQIAILTRFIAKEDFGIIAIATLFVGFTQLFLDMGISTGILHKQNITNKEYSSLFWLNIFVGVLLATILFFLAPLITAGYDSKELTLIVQLLCLTILINAIGIQQRTFSQKKFYFKRMAMIEIASAITTFLVAIISAYKGCGAFCLAYSSLAGAIVFNGCHFIIGLIKDSRLSFHFKLSETIPFLKIGIYQVGSSILDFFSRELDILIVSATLGMEFLGVYNIAKRIPTALYSFIQPIVSKVFTPLFAAINRNEEELKKKYILTSKALSWASFPMYFLVGALAPTILYYVFGKDYVDGAIFLGVFCVMYAFSGVNGICGALQVATGRTDIGFSWTIYRIISTAVIYYFSSIYGINAFIFGILLSILLSVFVIWAIQFRTMAKVSLKEYLCIYSNSLFICLFLTVLIIAICYEPSILYSIGIAVIYLALYIFLLLKTKDRNDIFDVCKILGINNRLDL